MNASDDHISPGRIRELKAKLDEVERVVNELGELGQGLLMVEKNTRSIHAFIHVLKQDISTVAEVLDSVETSPEA